MTTEPVKTCFKCGQEKPLSEFYEHPGMADGHLGKCKECAKRDARENYANKRKQYSEYERQRFKKPERKAATLATQRRRRAAHPEKEAAYNAVHRALRSGKLKRQPCKYCGSPDTQAHHADYSKPLEVEWVCFKCHREHEHGQTVVAVAPSRVHLNL
jgi:hypothetical protein